MFYKAIVKLGTELFDSENINRFKNAMDFFREYPEVKNVCYNYVLKWISKAQLGLAAAGLVGGYLLYKVYQGCLTFEILVENEKCFEILEDREYQNAFVNGLNQELDKYKLKLNWQDIAPREKIEIGKNFQDLKKIAEDAVESTFSFDDETKMITFFEIEEEKKSERVSQTEDTSSDKLSEYKDKPLLQILLKDRKQPKCSEISKEKLKEFLQTHNKKLKFLHWNADGLKRKIKDLEELIESEKDENSPDVICISETHKISNEQEVQIQGYKLEFLGPSTIKGGVAIYLKKHKFKEVNWSKVTQTELKTCNGKDCDYESCKLQVESKWVEFKRDADYKSLVVGAIYRECETTGDNLRCFKDQLETILNDLKKKNQVAYLLGNLNINLLEAKPSGAQKEFCRMLKNTEFKVLITKATQVTEKTSSLVDVILTNDEISEDACSVVVNDVSAGKRLHHPIIFVNV